MRMRNGRTFVALPMQAGIPQSCGAGATKVETNNSTRGKAMGAVVMGHLKACARCAVALLPLRLKIRR